MTDFQAVARRLAFRYLVDSEANNLREDDLKVVEVIKVGLAAEVTMIVQGYSDKYVVYFDAGGLRAELRTYIETKKTTIGDPFTRPYKYI